MRIILFGAGSTGRIALHFIGYDRIDCFVDNKRHGEHEQRKDIINFNQMLNIIRSDDIIVITSEKFYKELEKQLKDYGLTNYFIFHENDQWNIMEFLPCFPLYGRWEFVSYTRSLSYCHINQYKRIVIMGINPFIHYLLLEIAFQNDLSAVVGIIGEKDGKGQLFGVPFVELDSIWNSIDCLIINTKRIDSPIREILEDRKHEFSIIDMYDMDRIEPSFYHPELRKYKDIHKGKRAFIIGNGPSLRIEDLEILHQNNEICFAANKIYRIYDRTVWRANYLAMTDTDIISEVFNDIPRIGGDIFLGDSFCKGIQIEKLPNLNYIHFIIQEYYPNYPGFSDDIVYGVYLGNSVLYDICLQLAAYMGIKEVYLIGVDHIVVGDVTDKRNHFIADYYSESEYKRYKWRTFEKDKVTKAFKKAENYSKKHGFHIYNATRGGALEVFERVEFESIFYKRTH